MEEIATLIEAVASLLWPLLVLSVLFFFAAQIKAVLLSARSRMFTVKVGGQQLTMEEVREQQSALIKDLQVKVGDLEGALARVTTAGPPHSDTSRAIAAEPSPVAAPPRVLWVDDQPKNNSYYVEQLSSGGIEVDLALSTAEAVRRLDKRDYRVVISDMGRREDGKYERRAGLELLRVLREEHPERPLAFFTSSSGVSRSREEAMRLGANLVTSSGTELIQFLRAVLPEWDI